MADEKDEQENTLNKVARSVGSALGAAASAVEGIMGESTGSDAPAPQRSKEPAAAHARGKSGMTDQRAVRAHERQKEKRAKHRRKLHRKTRG